jgi:hypothetical protein
MKRIRTIILAAVILAALFATLVPALALDPYDAVNYSFEGDKNGDNIPDKWMVAGDVFRTCNHPYYPGMVPTPCAMIFPPSNHGAAVWQVLPSELHTLVVLFEEGYPTLLGEGVVGAKQLDWYRAYYGVRLTHEDGTTITLYDDIRGGTYPFEVQEWVDSVGTWVLGENTWPVVKFGILVFPGDGYLGVDSASIPFN